MIQIAMTPTQFQAAATKLKVDQGIDLIGMGGSISKSGVSATYSYDGATLKIVVTHAPFPVSRSFCESKMLAWLGTN